VPGHLSLGFAEVATDLESMGYDGCGRTLYSGEVGASHKRERLFILAVANDQSERRSEGRPEPERRDGQSVSADAGSAVGNPSGLFSGRRDGRGAGSALEKLLLPGQAKMWPTPNVPNGGRTTPEEQMTAGTTATGRKVQKPWPGRQNSGPPPRHDHQRRGIGRKEEGIGPDGVGRRQSASHNSELADPEGRGTVPIQQPGQPCCTVPCRDKLADAGHEGLSDAQQPGVSARRNTDSKRGQQLSNFASHNSSLLVPTTSTDGEKCSQSTMHLPRLNPLFVCWLMGWAEDRARWLRLYGNGVVPLQAAYAFCSLWAALRFNQ